MGRRRGTQAARRTSLPGEPWFDILSMSERDELTRLERLIDALGDIKAEVSSMREKIKNRGAMRVAKVIGETNANR